MCAKNIKTTGFGLIGCGAISSFHANAISQIEDAFLYGVFDENTSNSEALAQKTGAKAFKNIDDMLNEDSIDAVCICTPSFLHFPFAMECLKKHKHILVEKPLALNDYECEKLIDTANENGVVISAVSQLRYSEDFMHVKNAIKNNALGKITRCDIVMKYFREPGYYTSSPWRGTWEKDGGGALMNQGIHGVDLAVFLMGDVKSIYAKHNHFVRDIEVEDTLSALIIWQNGAHGILQASVADYPGFERRIEINGSEGYIIIKENKIVKWQFSDESKYKMPDLKKTAQTFSHKNPAAIDAGGHVAQIKNFIGAINKTEDLLTPPQDALKAVKIINSAYKSAKSGAEVML